MGHCLFYRREIVVLEKDGEVRLSTNDEALAYLQYSRARQQRRRKIKTKYGRQAKTVALFYAGKGGIRADEQTTKSLL